MCYLGLYKIAQTDGANPLYTGKIMSTDGVSIFHEDDGSTMIQRGDSIDSTSRMGPTQAPIIPFSWNSADWSTTSQRVLVRVASTCQRVTGSAFHTKPNH